MSSNCYLTVLYDDFVHSWCSDTYISSSRTHTNWKSKKRSKCRRGPRPVAHTRPQRRTSQEYGSVWNSIFHDKKNSTDGAPRQPTADLASPRASFMRIDLSSSFKDQSKILQGDLHLVGSALISLRFPYISRFLRFA
jgi:hypothetical protein